jgi:predicted secreted hydrolase
MVDRMRRRLVMAGATLPAAVYGAAGKPAPSDPGNADFLPQAPRPLAFPRDYGAHTDTRIEWWYLTGVLGAPDHDPAAAIGLQVTFFRLSTGIAPANPSRFAAHELVLAHAAIADPARGALLHDERMARTGFGIARAAADDTDVGVDGWSMSRDPARGEYRARVNATGFTVDLTATPTQARLLQGEGGYSRKGSNAAGHPAASFYYTEPQLALRARLRVEGRDQERSGQGWLDHEWSSALLPPQAAGWDWGGYNLADGSALTVFRIRAAGGDSAGQTLHAYASLRVPGMNPALYAPAQIAFTPLQYWTSPRTRARYPVAQRIQVGSRVFESHPIMPDQEYDARNSGGIVYWEGASVLRENGQPAGRGYLELTGYSGDAFVGALVDADR